MKNTDFQISKSDGSSPMVQLSPTLKHEFKSATVNSLERSVSRGFMALVGLTVGMHASITVSAQERPNFVVILADDLRYDGLGCSGNNHAATPKLDKLAGSGVRFTNAFATMAVCNASRAAILTGMYGSRNGVTTLGLGIGVKKGIESVASKLKDAGYFTATYGKWHLSNTPQELGFRDCVYYFDNGEYYNREVNDNGEKKSVPIHIDRFVSDRAVKFLQEKSESEQPFLLMVNLQLPHLAMHPDSITWDPRPDSWEQFKDRALPIPPTNKKGLEGKPPYLKNGRPHLNAISVHGYNDPHKTLLNLQSYHAVVNDMDSDINRILQTLQKSGLTKNTYLIFLSDNGYMMGEFQLTSKVLAYEPSIHIPMIISGPTIKAGKCDELVSNIDIAPTLLELAQLPEDQNMDRLSLAPILAGKKVPSWRNSFLYEVVDECLGVPPTYAVRTMNWIYVETLDKTYDVNKPFAELYNLAKDHSQITNVARNPKYRKTEVQLKSEMERLKSNLKSK